MDDSKKDDRYLDIKYDEQHKRMEDGSYRVERSADATLRHDDPKSNPRRDAEGLKEDKAARDAVRQPGQDSTHAVPSEQGARGDDRNVAPFSHTMNRREIREWEKQNEQMRASGDDVRVKGTFIHRADAEGNAEKSPIALKQERENLTTGDKSTVYYGNFSTNKQRAHDNAPDGEKPSKDEVREAARTDNALYNENRARKPDAEAQKEWRNSSREQLRSRAIEGGKDRGNEPERGR